MDLYYVVYYILWEGRYKDLPTFSVQSLVESFGRVLRAIRKEISYLTVTRLLCISTVKERYVKFSIEMRGTKEGRRSTDKERKRRLKGLLT